MYVEFYTVNGTPKVHTLVHMRSSTPTQHKAHFKVAVWLKLEQITAIWMHIHAASVLTQQGGDHCFICTRIIYHR